jgi:hypothetical protein
MNATKRNYLAILRIELDDLSTDIERLIEQCLLGAQQGMISKNVFMQNLATFKNELLGVHSFQHILDRINPDDYESLDLMVDDIRAKFQKLLKSHGLVGALQVYVNRKLDKVMRYINQ